MYPNRYVQQVSSTYPRVAFDAAGRLRVGVPTVLGDYKQIGFDKTILFDDQGTGTGGWSNNQYVMSVAGTQYRVKQSKRVHPYFSGYVQDIEATFDRFHHEAGVTKRIGYFSSSTAAPYSATLDGFFLESDGQNYWIRCYRAGTLTYEMRDQGWDNWTDVNHYDWSMFTVIAFDFLWLGGAVLRFWVKTGQGFTLIHTINYSGTSQDTIIRNPSQPLRCEIRSTNAGGQMRFICGQISTDGQVGQSGIGYSVNNGTPEITLASADTTYPLLAIRKKAARLEAPVEITGVNIGVGSANDRALWSVQINPTLSAPLTYADVANTSIQKADGNGIITVTSPGYVLASGPVATNVPIPKDAFERNFLTRLGQTLAGTMDEYVLCMGLQTAGIDSTGFMDVKEY